MEDAGYPSFSAYTAVALLLHDYQYHGPDPSRELSKYTTREEAARDVTNLLEKLAAIVEEQVEPRAKESQQMGPRPRRSATKAPREAPTAPSSG